MSAELHIAFTAQIQKFAANFEGMLSWVD